MRRLLFVDDELPILEGLQLRLRPLQRKWDMTFVDSGTHALAELERAPYDVIVTDMRMPGMDGAELLRLVSERRPELVRIVLSGYSDLQQTIRLVPLAHQYLSKPCEAQHLENTVERCIALQELLCDVQLRALVGRIRQLPAVPATFARLQATMARESSGAREVAAVVAQDSAIAAKVLQMVNSAFFRLSRRITSIEQAVNYLGLTCVRNLVMSAEVFGRWPQTAGHPTLLDLERLQHHAHTVAIIAQSFTAKTPLSDDTLLAALLHDIGYWILLQECPRDLEQAISTAIERGIPLHEAERQVIGSTHAEIGAYLLGLWGLPYSVVEAVAYHHVPGNVRRSGFDVLTALAVAGAFAPEDDAGAGVGLPPDTRVDSEYLTAVGAPFGWVEAERRAAECLKNGD